MALLLKTNKDEGLLQSFQGPVKHVTICVAIEREWMDCMSVEENEQPQ